MWPDHSYPLPIFPFSIFFSDCRSSLYFKDTNFLSVLYWRWLPFFPRQKFLIFMLSNSSDFSFMALGFLSSCRLSPSNWDYTNTFLYFLLLFLLFYVLNRSLIPLGFFVIYLFILRGRIQSFLLKYSWFTMLCSFQVYSKVIQLYIYIYSFSDSFPL